MSVADPIMEIHYPSSDGEPLAETSWHVDAILLLKQMLEDLLRKTDPDVFVAANMFWYFKKGDVTSCVAPDVMVFPKAGGHNRSSYKSWKEPVAAPSIVFEVSSEETVKYDLGGKSDLYASLGVAEYYLFDPQRLALDPPLCGFRLVKGSYVPLLERNGRLQSRFGFSLQMEDDNIRLFDREGQPVLTPYELAEQQKQRADEEKKRAEIEKRRAEMEKQRADAAEQEAAVSKLEIERLKALLKSQGEKR